MCWRQIRARQAIRPVAEACQLVRHGDDRAAERFVDQVGQTKCGNPPDFAQRLPAFVLERVREPPLERRNDRGAIVAPDGEHERKTELLRIGGVEVREAREFLGRARGETRTLLLACRFRRELAREPLLRGQLGMRTNERQLFIRGCLLDGRAHRPVQLESRAERAQRRDALGHPAGALKDARQRCRELRCRERVELLERNHGGNYFFAVLAGGWVAIQCRAISIRRQTQTPSCSRA